MISTNLICALLTLAASTQVDGRVEQVQDGMEFSPNTLIVKLKEGVSDVPSYQDGPEVKGLASLKKIQPRSHMKEVRSLFKGFGDHRREMRSLRSGERSARTQRDERLLRRLHRAPQGATVPDLSRIYRIKVDLEPGESLQDVLAAYRSHPDVEYAELDYRVSLCRVPSDPDYSQQWALKKISAPQAWDLHTGSLDVIVAVIDTGVTYTHPDIQDNMWVNAAELHGQEGVDDDGNGYIDDVYGYDFANEDGEPLDDFSHGTHVAGIIAAIGDNQTQVCGICWKATIMAIKATDPDTLGQTSNIIEGIYYAVCNGADVLSCSWGMNPPSQALAEAFQYAYSQGVVAVAAAGNDKSNKVFYPAGYPTVISVGASTEQDQRASFSNYGSWVDIMAPGVNILSLSPWGTQLMQGTSMACPHVSGACALMLSVNPYLTPDRVEELIVANGDAVMQGTCRSNSRLNLYKAVGSVVSPGGTIYFDKETYPESGDMSVWVLDADLKGKGSCEIGLTTDGNDAEPLVLTEKTPATGIYQGRIAIQIGTPSQNDGLLQVSDGQVVIAKYLDQSGAGRYQGIKHPVTNNVVIDGRPPTASGIKIDASSPQPAVTFETDEPTLASVHFRKAGTEGPVLRVSSPSIYAKHHSLVLQPVTAQTDYTFEIEVTDQVGHITQDNNLGMSYGFSTVPDPGHLHVPADYPTLQEAIDHCWDGDTVWVADGTYTGPGNRDIDFNGKAITVRSENGPKACIIDSQGSAQDPHRGFYFHHRETADSILDGLTITDGYRQGDLTNGTISRGGGILCNASGPTLRNLILKNNSATDGGGLYAYNGCNMTLSHCQFVDNAATHGAGVYGGDESTLSFTDCEFSRNRANSYYGGLFCGYENTRADLTRCLFQENSATYGGGAMGCGTSRVTITECQFIGNTVGGQSWARGGAIMASSGEISILGCLFSGNRSGQYGAALFNDRAHMNLINCTFAGNMAQDGRAAVCFSYGTDIPFLEATNCILWDGGKELFLEGSADILVRYSDVQGDHPGEGNLDADPCFVDPGHWNDPRTPNNLNDDNWINGDYHLLSAAGYWSPAQEGWITAQVTSPCIDAGDPNWPVGLEPEPNGGRINLGAYGGTDQASRSVTSSTFQVALKEDKAKPSQRP